MTLPIRVAAAAVAILVVALGHNLFGGVLNPLFLAVPGIDKVLHVAGYCALFAGIHVAATRVGVGAPTPFATVVCVVLSLADEFVQSFSALRTVDAHDVAANMAGVALGWVLRRGRADMRATAAATIALALGTFLTVDTRTKVSDYTVGLRYSQQHDFVRAREHYQRAYDAGLRNAGLLNEMAWVEIESGIGNPARAVDYAAAALALQSDNPDILDTYGWALHHAGRSEEALGALRRAYEAQPEMYCIDYHLGAAYLAANDRVRAEAHFRRQWQRKNTREALFAGEALKGMGIILE